MAGGLRGRFAKGFVQRQAFGAYVDAGVGAAALGDSAGDEGIEATIVSFEHASFVRESELSLIHI